MDASSLFLISSERGQKVNKLWKVPSRLLFVERTLRGQTRDIVRYEETEKTRDFYTLCCVLSEWVTEPDPFTWGYTVVLSACLSHFGTPFWTMPPPFLKHVAGEKRDVLSEPLCFTLWTYCTETRWRSQCPILLSMADVERPWGNMALIDGPIRLKLLNSKPMD